MAILILVLLHLGWLGTGLVALEILSSRARFSLRRLLEAYFTGGALNVTILYAWAAVAPVPIEAARVLIGGGVILGLAWLVFHHRSITFGNTPAMSKLSAVDLVLLAQLVPPILLILVSAWCVPIVHWDPLAIWTNKAGLLFHGEFLHSEAFVDRYWVQPHPGYPIGYSLVLFEHAAAAGWMDELMMNRGLILIVGAGLTLLVVLMSEWAGRRMAMVALGLLVWTPAVFRPGLAGAASSGYADLPLGLAAALAAGLFVRGLANRDKHSLTAAAATLILALSFKNEGLVWTVLICALGLAAVALRREWRRPSIWLALAAPLVALVLLRMAHLHLPTSSDVAIPSMSDVVALLALTPSLTTLGFEQLIANPTWGVLRFCLPVAFGIGLVRARHEPLALFSLAAPVYLIIAFAALGLTEVQLGTMEYFSLSMFPRLIMQLLPSAVLFSVILNSPGFVNARLEGHSCYGDPSRRPRTRPNPDAEQFSMTQKRRKPMTTRMTMSLFLAVSLSIVGACSAEHHAEESPEAQTEAAPQSDSANDSTATGTVAETMNAGNYTYVRVTTSSGEIWAAATRFDVAVGDVVVVPLEMPMQDFHSESLDRTFPVIYFTSQILRQGEAASPSMPQGHPPVSGETAAAHESSTEVAPVEPAEGGATVGRIWSEATTLDGAKVTVRGRVVKFNGGILGTNWIHLQDGTGSAADGTHDLTVTTLATASVGDVVTATGTLVTNQDFGAGYTFAVMLKDAELIAD